MYEVVVAAARRNDEDAGDEASTRKVRGHIRRAHWHSFWHGPREGERQLKLRWMHPTLVNLGADRPTIVRVKP